MLVGSVLVIAVSIAPPKSNRALIWTGAAILPVIPFIAGYKLTTEAGGALFPVWRYLENPFSPSNWFLQLQAADPFQLLTRKGFPFVAGNASLFAVFSPFLWLAAALLCLLAATYFFKRRGAFLTRQSVPFVFITAGSILFWNFRAG